ncbi:hypothetical protein CEQ90_03160 [Lewinellaceae bacterium SD302]|nr:hypothetical protein CEQ90_03160 [Lewinellaceae bacterium SD302]
MSRILTTLFISCLLCGLPAQYIDHIQEDEGGSFFGVRGGLSIGTQSWSGFEMNPLLTYHGDVFLETLPENGRFSLWASLGYHIRGSRIQQRRVFDLSGNPFQAPGESFQFQNASLAVGGKSVFAYTKIADVYYTIGLRLDYTIDTNLDDYNDLSEGANSQFRAFYPFDTYEFINRINYGLTFGGGVDIPLSDKIGVVLQVTAQPDFSLQYNQPAIDNVASPFQQGQNVTLPERKIRNFTLEVSAGFRFLRKVQYID